MDVDEHHGSWVGEYIWGRYGDWRKVRYSHLVFDYILWKVMSTMGNGFVSYIWDDMVTLVRLGTLILLLLTFCGRWGAPLVGELHLRKYYCPSKVSYNPLTFGYFLWKVSSHHRLVSCIWGSYIALILVTLPLLLVTSCGRWGAPLVGE